MLFFKNKANGKASAKGMSAVPVHKHTWTDRTAPQAEFSVG